jgi:hypothetical protein
MFHITVSCGPASRWFSVWPSAADDRRRYLLELLQSAAGPDTHGACDDDLNELLARSKDEKVLFDHLQRTLQLREVASHSKGCNKTEYSRLANAVEIAPLVSAVFQSQQSKGKALISSHAYESVFGTPDDTTVTWICCLTGAPELTDLGKGKRVRQHFTIPAQCLESKGFGCSQHDKIQCETVSLVRWSVHSMAFILAKPELHYAYVPL